MASEDTQAAAHRLYIREWRKKHGMTQEQLAVMIDRAPSAVSQIETASQGVALDTLLLIADAFQIGIGDLFVHPDKAIPPLTDAQAKLLRATRGLDESTLEKIGPVLEELIAARRAPPQ
jgi:transcriptional regulator with XRE-family HTH domain